jgi:hypothetical protein
VSIKKEKASVALTRKANPIARGRKEKAKVVVKNPLDEYIRINWRDFLAFNYRLLSTY